MRIFYHISSYISHRVAAEAYIACLRELGHTVLTDPAEAGTADFAILHDDPLALPPLFDRLPQLASMRTAAYCVWETERLPGEYVGILSRVGEIWTCSEFCRRAFAEHFPRVAVLPHIVERPSLTPQALAFARAATGAEDGAFLFFSIVDSLNPRKNLPTLLAAFSLLRGRVARKVRLVLKQYRAALDLAAFPDVVSLSGQLENAEMAALHAVCHAYVSAHHAEGWGLGLSASMAFGRPVIATGYSGNMEYMDAGNSVPLPYVLEPVSEEMSRRIPWFTPDMRWARVDANVLASAMKDVAECRTDPDLPVRAGEISRRFGPASVSRILSGLLERGAPAA